MGNSDILRILSPLALFIFHLIYLVAVSKDPFLNKWIDGSFTFFVALVLCNIIRARVVAHADLRDQPDEPRSGQDDQDGPGGDRTPK